MLSAVVFRGHSTPVPLPNNCPPRCPLLAPPPPPCPSSPPPNLLGDAVRSAADPRGPDSPPTPTRPPSGRWPTPAPCPCPQRTGLTPGPSSLPAGPRQAHTANTCVCGTAGERGHDLAHPPLLLTHSDAHFPRRHALGSAVILIKRPVFAFQKCSGIARIPAPMWQMKVLEAVSISSPSSISAKASKMSCHECKGCKW